MVVELNWYSGSHVRDLIDIHIKLYMKNLGAPGLKYSQREEGSKLAQGRTIVGS